MALVELVTKKAQQGANERLLGAIESAEAIARTARRHRKSLLGGGFYASKFSEAHAEAMNSLRELKDSVGAVHGHELKQVFVNLESDLGKCFEPATDIRERGRVKQRMMLSIRTSVLPLQRRRRSHNPSDSLFPLEIVKGTRSYIEKVAQQACGCYDLGWFDGASVMARRLLETLIVELYEERKLDHKIKRPDGGFQQLGGLISVVLAETAFNLGRNTKKSLPLLKDMGDLSAHNRRYTARQQDLDSIKRELRVTIEEFVHLIGFK